MISDSIKIGKWLPDQPSLDNLGCLGAKNVIYSNGNYVPLSGVNSLTGSLPDDCKGAISVVDSDGNIYSFAGTAGHLYLLDSNEVWQEVSKSGGYGTSNSNVWKFEIYGNLLIATNFNDYPQKFELGTDTNFSDLTTALKAKFVKAFRNRIVFAYTYDSTDGVRRNRVRWSGLDAPTDYTISATTGSDFQDVAEINEIMGIERCQGFIGVLGDEVISRMEYSGYPAIFSFITAEEQRGTLASGSIISDGKRIYYLGRNGFYAFNGSESMPIGHLKVDKSFFQGADISSERHIFAGVDLKGKFIIWNYHGINEYTSYPSKHIIYNYLEDAWSEAEIAGYIPVIYRSSGYNLEELDDFGNLDNLPFSLDSDIWRGGRISLGIITADGKLGTFTGDAMQAEIITKEVQINKDGLTFISGVYPETDAANITADLGYRNILNEDVEYLGSSVLEDNGSMNFDNEAKYHRLKFQTSGNYSSFQGFKIRYEVGGEF